MLQAHCRNREKEKRLTCIHEHGDEKSNQMDSVLGINTFHSQDSQLENDRKEQFYAERLHLCGLHGVAAALRERSKMRLRHLQAPDKAHEHPGEHCSHELSGNLESPHPDGHPAAPHGLQGTAGVAYAAGQSQAMQDAETVGERERRVRLGVHSAQHAQLVGAGTNLEGAEHLQKESVKALVGSQLSAGQSPAQSHRHHDAGHEQKRRPKPADGHGEGCEGQRVHLSPAPPPVERKKRGKGRENAQPFPLG